MQLFVVRDDRHWPGHTDLRFVVRDDSPPPCGGQLLAGEQNKGGGGVEAASVQSGFISFESYGIEEEKKLASQNRLVSSSNLQTGQGVLLILASPNPNGV